MPDIENLMQEWPPQFEEALKKVRHYLLSMVICQDLSWSPLPIQVGLPSADLDCDLPTYSDIVCCKLCMSTLSAVSSVCPHCPL